MDTLNPFTLTGVLINQRFLLPLFRALHSLIWMALPAFWEWRQDVGAAVKGGDLQSGYETLMMLV